MTIVPFILTGLNDHFTLRLKIINKHTLTTVSITPYLATMLVWIRKVSTFFEHQH